VYLVLCVYVVNKEIPSLLIWAIIGND
jgi:hypothetical protein